MNRSHRLDSSISYSRLANHESPNRKFAVLSQCRRRSCQGPREAGGRRESDICHLFSIECINILNVCILCFGNKSFFEGSSNTWRFFAPISLSPVESASSQKSRAHHPHFFSFSGLDDFLSSPFPFYSAIMLIVSISNKVFAK